MMRRVDMDSKQMPMTEEVSACRAHQAGPIGIKVTHWCSATFPVEPPPVFCTE